MVAAQRLDQSFASEETIKSLKRQVWSLTNMVDVIATLVLDHDRNGERRAKIVAVARHLEKQGKGKRIKS
jgi:hypothetical protein